MRSQRLIQPELLIIAGNIVEQNAGGLITRCMGHCGPDLLRGESQHGSQHPCHAIEDLIQSGLCSSPICVIAAIQTILDDIQIEVGHIHHAEVIDGTVYAVELVAHASDGTPIYRGACRGLSADEITRRSALRAPATRLRVPTVDDLASDVIEFVDRTYGAQCEALATECGDFLVRRSDGVFAYQLAVVVDDAAMGVTEIVRGCDLLGSTPRQIYLQHLLGLPTPHYAHIPLLMSPDGRRLSKRDRDLDLGELRTHFGTPEALLGWLAGQTGIAPDTTPRTAEQLVEHFSWDVIRAHRENITVTVE